jgi:hypothetical protein
VRRASIRSWVHTWTEEGGLMAGDDTRYDLQVFYSVTRADDIDILDEGRCARDSYRSPTDALGDLGHFIRENGGPDMWDEIDQYEIGSCWLRHGADTEISYQARMDRVIDVAPGNWAPPASARTPAMVTWGRLNIATFGGLPRPPRER